MSSEGDIIKEFQHRKVKLLAPQTIVKYHFSAIPQTTALRTPACHLIRRQSGEVCCKCYGSHR